MKKHYAQYFHEVIEGQKRTIEVLSSAVKEAEKSASEMREKYLHKKIGKKLTRRSGLEDPYGLATPSSRKVNKSNSTPENQARRGGANKGHKGHGRKDFSPYELALNDYREKVRELKNQIMKICESSANHPGIQHIQNIFRENTDCLFQWIRSPDIPAENNYAERGLRPTVIARKISFGSHSERGMRTREILMTVMHTAKCRGRDPAEFMEEVLDIFAQDKSADISHLLIPEKTQKDKSVA